MGSKPARRGLADYWFLLDHPCDLLADPPKSGALWANHSPNKPGKKSNGSSDKSKKMPKAGPARRQILQTRRPNKSTKAPKLFCQKIHACHHRSARSLRRPARGGAGATQVVAEVGRPARSGATSLVCSWSCVHSIYGFSRSARFSLRAN